MNEHEASVANRITAKGHPIVAVFAILAMRLRFVPVIAVASYAINHAGLLK